MELKRRTERKSIVRSWTERDGLERKEGSMRGDGRGLDEWDEAGLCETGRNATRQGATSCNGAERDGTGWNRMGLNGTG